MAPPDKTSSIKTRSGSRDEGDLGEKMETLFQEIKAFREETKLMCVSIDSTHEKIDELKVMFNNQRVDINKCLEEVEDLKTENSELKKELHSTRQDMYSLQQYMRRNAIDIQGVPETKSENILGVVQNIAKVLRFELQPGMIDAVHRLSGGGKGVRRPRGIILKFVRRLDCDEFLRLSKVKRGCKASDLGYTSDNRVYINPSLSQNHRELLFLARKAVRDGIVKYAWYQNGKVLVRKAEGLASTHIVSREQLHVMVRSSGVPSSEVTGGGGGILQ